ncbi:serine hydrolase domain-containing protein [Legionella anisa]|uniref:serine hydrolase domain-containing protein n=1 Tax=Legionella anisa TaxID=28082 RepID=UPI0010411065|nr:serine hydrolase [Legionella anisa]
MSTSNEEMAGLLSIKTPGKWAQKDLVQKQEILRSLYNNIDKLSPADKEGLVGYLAVCLKKDKEEVRALFESVSETERSIEGFEEFEVFFQELKPLDAKVIPFNCPDIGFNPWPELSEGQYLPESSSILLEEYLEDSDIAAAVSASDAYQIAHVAAADVDGRPNVYPIHSVAKVFTGVLAIMMMHEKPDGEHSIVPEANLDLPIKGQLDPEAWALLPDNIRAHLERNNVTLGQLMTHKGGVGDYGYDSGTGTYRERLEAGELPEVIQISDFLQFAEDKTYPVGQFHYSNLGITLVGLAVENAYRTYRESYHALPLPPLNFFAMLKHFVLDDAKMTNFFERAPMDSEHTVLTNPADKAALGWVGGPAGGYWTTTDDLVKFGQWLYKKCQDATFRDLIQQYGEEFYSNGRIMHPGSSPYSSAFFFLDLATGKTGAIASTDGSATSLGLEIALGEQVFTSVPSRLAQQMKAAAIPGLTVASVSAQGTIAPVVIGVTDKNDAVPIKPNTPCGAASLSKPVFAYLVLKLIEANVTNTAEVGLGQFILPDGVTHFDLDTPLADILPLGECTIDGVPKFDTTDKAAVASASKLTARMVLSHQTGLAHGALSFQFKPGEGHGYSNVAILYLQQVIEKLTKANLEAPTEAHLEVLARKHVFEPLHMDDSTFIADKTKPLEAQATNSLHTTPSDYARFVSVLMHDKECSLVKMPEPPTLENQKASVRSRFILTETGFFYYNKSQGTLQAIVLDPLGVQLANLHHRFAEVAEDKPIDVLSNDQMLQIKSITGHTHILQEAFIPQVLMTDDKGLAGKIGVARGAIPEADLSHVAWGLGWGLQIDDNGCVTTAYHSGDMNQWRAWVAMNLEDKTATVFFANSHNGHVLAEQIIPRTIQLEHAANYFFQKWGFARDIAQLGERLDNWGLRSDEVALAATVLDADDTALTALEASADSVTQQYKAALGNITHSRVVVAPPKEETVVVERSFPSPFKMEPTLKPPGADDS